VDIGAGLGDFTILAAHGFPNSRVYAYEPFMESFTLLGRNLVANQIKNVEIFQQAVGQTGALVLDLSGGEPLQIQSHQDQNGGGGDSERSVKVTSLALNEVFVQNGIRRCDLLKLDCEGAEYDILLNAKPECLERVQRVVMEYHEGVNGHTHHDLVAFLEGLGFAVSITPNRVHAYLGYLYASRSGMET
jgi:FkbM family methyltransferase